LFLAKNSRKASYQEFGPAGVMPVAMTGAMAVISMAVAPNFGEDDDDNYHHHHHDDEDGLRLSTFTTHHNRRQRLPPPHVEGIFPFGFPRWIGYMSSSVPPQRI